jgi:hypothetical protein
MFGHYNITNKSDLKNASIELPNFIKNTSKNLSRKPYGHKVYAFGRNQEKESEKPNSFFSGAAARDRTGTGVAPREILSLLRLPISPQRHA